MKTLVRMPDRQEINRHAGYHYGTAPVIEASLEFEAYMLRDVYVPLMPDGIKALLKIQTDNG